MIIEQIYEAYVKYNEERTNLKKDYLSKFTKLMSNLTQNAAIKKRLFKLLGHDIIQIEPTRVKDLCIKITNYFFVTRIAPPTER